MATMLEAKTKATDELGAKFKFNDLFKKYLAF